MKDQTYRILLAAVMILGVISTVILVLVTIRLYRSCSIITYIANGR